MKLGYGTAKDLLAAMPDTVRFEYSEKDADYRLYGIGTKEMFMPSWVVKAQGTVVEQWSVLVIDSNLTLLLTSVILSLSNLRLGLSLFSVFCLKECSTLAQYEIENCSNDKCIS